MKITYTFDVPNELFEAAREIERVKTESEFKQWVIEYLVGSIDELMQEFVE